MTIGVAISSAVVGSLCHHQAEANGSNKTARTWKAANNIFAGICASELVIIALKATRYAVKNINIIEGLFAAAIAIPILAALGSKYKVDLHLTKALNGVSLVASVAAVAFGSLPLVGMGGLAIAVNSILIIHDHVE